MADGTKTRKVHYRLASFEGGEPDQEIPTFESSVRSALSGDLGSDYTSRMFRISDDRPDQAMINNSDAEPPGVFLELFHLDSRRELPFVQKGRGPTPIAKVVSRVVPDDEDAMGSAAYLLVVGNHVAAIEPFALRVGALQSYFNSLFQAAGLLEAAQHWKLAPKVQLSDTPAATHRGVTRLEIEPLARLVGDAPSRMPDNTRSRSRRPPQKTEAKMARGDRVLDILRLLGTPDTDLEEIRSSMSSDLGLEARIEILVRKNNQKTDAKLETADIAQAVASLEENNRVSVVSPDGRSRQQLTTLTDLVEIAEVGGLLPLKNVASALVSVLYKWSGSGMIDISAHLP